MSAIPYVIEEPVIPSGDIYFFETDSDIKYEVRFGRLQDDFSSRIINFSVINQDHDDEYTVTNKGEIYRVMATIVKIVMRYNKKNPHARKFQFSGEYKENDKDRATSIRTTIFNRFAERTLSDDWKIQLEDNKVITTKVK